MNKTITAGEMAKLNSQQAQDIAPLKNLAIAMIGHQKGFAMEDVTKTMAVIHHEAILREDKYLFEDRGIELNKDDAKLVINHCLEKYDNYKEKGYRIAVGLQADKAINAELTVEQFENYDPRTFTFGLNYRHRTSEQQTMWLNHLRTLAGK